MLTNFPYIDIGKKNKFDNERILLSASIVHFSPKGVTENQLIVITKHKIFILKDESIRREILISEIESVTNSVTSHELILHIEDSFDERISCFEKKKEIIQWVIQLQTSFSSPSLTPSPSKPSNFKMKVFMVPDLSLDIYLTTAEDIEEGHQLRPDEKYMRLLNFKEFEEVYEKFNEKHIQDTKSTRNLLRKHGQKVVTIEDFELVKTLGKGAHGKVLLCERRGLKGERFAMKIIKKKHIIELNQIEHTIAEKIILSRMNHPFLVSLKQAFQNEHKIYFVMEFMKGGELFQHLKRMKRFSEEQTRFIAGCVVMALGHLHNKDYVYRDLKPENVLLDEKGFAKLTDFGLAKNLSNSDVAKTFCGTPEYLAPEIILEKGSNRPADWWSLGILVYEMLFGIPPFYSKDQQEMYRKTLLQPLKFSSKVIISPEAKDFIAGLLVKAPQKRLGAIADSLEVMSHPWFKDFNWRKLLDKTMPPPYNPMDTEWECNFDPGFTCEPAKDSLCLEDPQLFKHYEKAFDVFNDQSQDEEPESNPKVNEKNRLSSLDSIFMKESDDCTLGVKFKEAIIRENQKQNKSHLNLTNEEIKGDQRTPKEISKCSKRLNFSEDGHQNTPDTLSHNSIKTVDPKECSKMNTKKSFPTKNSFEISDSQLKDLEVAFSDQFE